MNSLRSHLILLVLCAMIPAVGLAIYVNVEQRHTGTETVKREALWASHSAAQESQIIFNTVRVILSDIAKRPEVRNIEQPSINVLLRLLLKENAIFQTLAVADASGTLVANALETPSGYNISERPYFQRTLRYRSFQIGEHAFSKTTGKRTIHLSYPVLSADGQVRFVIIASLDMSAFERLHSDKEGHLPYGATLSLTDRNGIIFYRYPKDEVYLGNPLPKDSWEYTKTSGVSEGTYSDVGVDGQKRIYAFHRLDLTDQESDIWVRVGIPAAMAYRQANEIMVRQMLILILVCLSALYITRLLGNQLVLEPVSRLTDAARKIAEGDMSARADIDDKGEFGQLARCFNDMAEAIYRREEDLIQAKEFAEAASSAKTRFVATMSHEIRTPLNGVIGMADLAMMAETDESQREYLQSIRDCAMSLLDIVNDILDFSKIESGRIELESTEFDPRTMVENAVKIIAPKCHEKRIELLCHISSDMPPAMIGDPLRIRQILTNLLNNAVKFTEQGKIIVKVESEIFKVRDESDCSAPCSLYFEIEDTGIGIPQDKINIIFESFMQADDSTTRRYGGTGLGLAISKNLAQMMGGYISVKSEPGKGSIFDVAIPLRLSCAPVKKLRQNPENILPKKSGTVMVAEDNSVNMMIITQYILKTGCQVIQAENGSEACRKFKDNKIDLIFMDIHMPEMDGFEAVKKIREYENGTKHTPIVAVTADAMNGDKEKCLISGMDDYIAKPFRREDVFAAIQRFVADSE